MREYVKRDCQCPRARHKHGTRMAYNADGCRCFACTLASSRRAKVVVSDYKIDATGTQRRLRALYANGHTLTSLGERLGLRVQSVREIAGLSAQHPWKYVYAETDRKVREIYDELSDVKPEGTAAKRARLSAGRKGWLPPTAWDDDTIDDPEAVSLDADPAKLTREQRLRLAVQLVEYGATQKQAAKRCRLADDTIREAMKKGEAA